MVQDATCFSLNLCGQSYWPTSESERENKGKENQHGTRQVEGSVSGSLHMPIV